MRPTKKFIVKCRTWEDAQEVVSKIAVFTGRYYETYSTDDGLLYKRLTGMTMNKESPPVMIIYDGEMIDIMPMLILHFHNPFLALLNALLFPLFQSISAKNHPESL